MATSEYSLARRIRHSRPVKWVRKFAIHEPFNIAKQRLFWRVIPYTMCSQARLNNAYELAQAVERLKLEGDLVECGVYRGGCAAILAWVVRRSDRRTWLFDSFEGLPEPGELDGAEAAKYARERASGKLAPIDRCVGPLAAVDKILFGVLALDREKIVIRKGWFQDTVPGSREAIGPIALLRLDGDWYESTRICLDHLYDNVVRGGFIILDDYNRWEGCKRAWDEFARARGLDVEFQRIDASGVYFRKP